ncbi:MAG TPA: glycosyltransferase family 39 protein [Roseiarcus sp.]|nr:glycosyltransferase family 39 protein [Roseiarcus sp.]
MQQSPRATMVLDGVAPAGRIAAPASAMALAIILGFALARVIFSVSLDFGIDEAYTLAIARRLDWSYFDHPPLHQWIAHFAALALGENAAARLPFIALFAGTGWLVFALTRDLFGAKAGVWAVFALNATPFFFASAGAWIVPDGPLLCALAAAAWCLSRVFFHKEAAIWPLCLAAGASLGLAGLSKYNAAFFPLGLALFLSFSRERRRWLRHPAPYCAALVAIVLIAPVLVWNAENGWVSFLFQGGRGAPGGHWRPAQVAAMALSEIALLSPWVFLPLLAGLISAVRLLFAGRDDGGRRLFLLCLALPAIVVFTLTPLWGARGLPHWPMPGWLFAYPLLGVWLAEREGLFARRAWALGSAAALALVAGLAVAEARTGFLVSFVPRLGGGDPALEALSWSKLRQAPLFAAGARPAFVVATKWTEAGKIAEALGPDVPVAVFSNEPHGFAFLHDPASFVGEDAVIVVARKRLAESLAALAPFFAGLGEPQSLSLGRGGRDEIDLALVPARRLLRPYPLPYPRRADSAPQS